MQNWEVNPILVNLTSYFIAPWKVHPLSTASVPGFPLWAVVLHGSLEGLGVFSFSSPLCEWYIPLVQSKHHCALHPSTALYGVTDFFHGRSQDPDPWMYVFSILHWPHLGELTLQRVSVASQIRDLNQIMSHFNSNFKQMLECTTKPTQEYICVCGLVHGKAENWTGYLLHRYLLKHTWLFTFTHQYVWGSVPGSYCE